MIEKENKEIMGTFLKKVKSKLRMLCDNFKKDCRFSINLAFLHFLVTIFNMLRFKKLSSKASKRANIRISNYLKKFLDETIKKHSSNSYTGKYEKNAPIWICWWDGEFNAPPLVQQCIKSTKKHAGNHPVYFIDKDSYSHYLDIPEYILKKVNDKKIGLANFSDYLRFSLLEKYGGLWLDATVFSTDTIPESYFEMPFFTCKSEPRECGYISKMRWTSFIIGGWKNNSLFKFFKDSWEHYWKKYDQAIDYLLVDHLINIAYNENKIIKEIIDNVPINNVHRDDLQAAMNGKITKTDFCKVLNPDTILYKLSWREKYDTVNELGQETVYNYFIETDIDTLLSEIE